MEYPATQMFVNDDDEENDEKEKNPETPLRAEKDVKVGLLVVDSNTYPVYRGVNIVGRIDTCSIVIDDNTISKKHAEIEAGMGSKSTFISDLGSLNKTKLNDAVLRPGRLYQLQDGDVIRFGSVQTVFKVEENKAEKSFVQTRDHDDFVIPETPAPISKESRSIIPGTPDLSPDRSSIGGNCSSDASIVAGTQEAGNINGRSSPRLSREPSSLRGSSRDQDLGTDKEDSTEMNPQDISEMETQKNISTDYSDEENIFDMITQQSDIHDDETQRFSTDDVRTVNPSRYTLDQIESYSPSMEDLETQKFNNDDGIDARSCSINDLETQKFPIDGIQSRLYSINDVEPQRIEARDKDDQDSETDEEGIFEGSGDGNVDMFDAPTQLITNRSSCERNEIGENFEVEMVAVPIEEEMTQRQDAGSKENEEPNDEVPAESACMGESDHSRNQTSTQVETLEKVNDEKRATPNDSIESKLNHMFDDVNETDIEEPTQMLTQHLENILEITQDDGSKHIADAGDIPNTGTHVDASEDKLKSGESDEDRGEKYATIKDIQKEVIAVDQVPQILSTQELFDDLPAVTIFGTPSASLNRGKTKALRPTNVKAVSKSKKSKKSARNIVASGPKLAGETESVDTVDSKRSKSGKNTESKVAESRTATIEENNTNSKVTNRRKPKVQRDIVANISSASNSEKSNSTIDERAKAKNKKSLPLKKRGSSTFADLRTPPTAVAEAIVLSPRAGTRSNRQNVSRDVGIKMPVKPSRTSTRSKVQKSKRTASISMEKVTYAKPDALITVLPASTDCEPLNRNRKGTRLRKNEETSRKELLDASAVCSNEEVTSVKRPRSLAPNIDDPSALTEKRKKLNVSESLDCGINQNESLPAQRCKLRSAVNTSTFENLDNQTQPSLESQEIQAILGSIDHGEHEICESVRGIPRQRKEMRIFRSHVTGNGRGKDSEDRDSSGNGVTEFSKTEKSRADIEESFAKPVDKPERKKRQLRRSQLDAKKDDDENDVSKTSDDQDLVNTSRKRAKPRGNSSNGETSGTKLTKNQKIADQKNKVQDPPRPVIVSKKSTPKNQTLAPIPNEREVSRRTVDRAEKENVVEEPAPKRGRKRIVEVKPGNQKSDSIPVDDDKISVSLSPLRRGRSSTSSATISSKTEHKVLFTGLNNADFIFIVYILGGTITEKPDNCTVLVTDKVRRTFKFLCGMAMAVPIVSIQWLKESHRNGRFLETDDFILKDSVEEAKFKFNLRQSLAMATGDKLLEGYTVVLTPNMAPPPNAEMKAIIQACGGKALVRPPARWPEKSLIISRQEDAKNVKKFLTKAPKSVRILSVEFILTGILRHELNFDEHKLEIV